MAELAPLLKTQNTAIHKKRRTDLVAVVGLPQYTTCCTGHAGGVNKDTGHPRHRGGRYPTHNKPLLRRNAPRPRGAKTTSSIPKTINQSVACKISPERGGTPNILKTAGRSELINSRPSLAGGVRLVLDPRTDSNRPTAGGQPRTVVPEKSPRAALGTEE